MGDELASDTFGLLCLLLDVLTDENASREDLKSLKRNAVELIEKHGLAPGDA